MRGIFHPPKVKDTEKSASKFIYYFYNTEDKKLYRLRKENYTKLENNMGYLLKFEYKYNIDSVSKKHILQTEVRCFTEYSQKEIDENNKLTSEKPYAFGLDEYKVSSALNPEMVTVDNTSKTIVKSIFDTYKNETRDRFKEEINADKLADINGYQDTYGNLLDKYYKKSNSSDNDVFNLD